MASKGVQYAGAQELRGHEMRRLLPIPEHEALTLLASVELGRLVFTEHALPAIRPLNHIIDDGDVIIRTRLGAGAAAKAIPPVVDVVTYEADHIEYRDRVGWSVVITGRAAVITDPERLRRCTERLHPWVDLPMNMTIAIEPEIVTGFRLALPSRHREPRWTG